jgi:hypothetical protein
MSRRPLDFDIVREMALTLPDVKESTGRGATSLKVCGRLLTCPAIHKSAEPHSLVVNVGFDQRAKLIATDPEVFYVTDHYQNYPSVLVRISRIRRDALRDLLGLAWQFANDANKTRKRRVRNGGASPRGSVH